MRYRFIDMGSVKRTITDADIQAAKNLKRIWNEKKRSLNLTQEKVAEEFGFRTQAAVSHYLLGRRALGAAAVLRFAQLLNVSPTEIRPDFQYKDVLMDLPANARNAALIVAALPEDVQSDILRLLESIKESHHPDILVSAIATPPSPSRKIVPD